MYHAINDAERKEFFMSGNHKYCKYPTQQLAARWLREVHGVVVDVVFEPPKLGKDWRYFIGDMDDMAWVGDFCPIGRSI